MNTHSPTPVPGADADTSLILAAFSPATRRQLELTVNALSRAVRKSIRFAETLERSGHATPEESSATWQRVTDRSNTLREFIRSLVLEPAPVPVPVSAPVSPTQPAPEPAAETAVTPANTCAPTDEEGEHGALDVDDDLILWANEELRKIGALPEHSRQTIRFKERATHKLLLKIKARSPALAAHIKKIALAAA